MNVTCFILTRISSGSVKADTKGGQNWPGGRKVNGPSPAFNKGEAEGFYAWPERP